jgi:hypothetical protein
MSVLDSSTKIMQFQMMKNVILLHLDFKNLAVSNKKNPCNILDVTMKHWIKVQTNLLAGGGLSRGWSRSDVLIFLLGG